jgi:hypothetical protein
MTDFLGGLAGVAGAAQRFVGRQRGNPIFPNFNRREVIGRVPGLHDSVKPQLAVCRNTRVRVGDRIGREIRPRAMPKYGVAAFPTIWWRDSRRVAKLSGSDG